MQNTRFHIAISALAAAAFLIALIGIISDDSIYQRIIVAISALVMTLELLNRK